MIEQIKSSTFFVNPSFVKKISNLYIHNDSHISVWQKSIPAVRFYRLWCFMSILARIFNSQVFFAVDVIDLLEKFGIMKRVNAQRLFAIGDGKFWDYKVKKRKTTIRLYILSDVWAFLKLEGMPVDENREIPFEYLLDYRKFHDLLRFMIRLIYDGKPISRSTLKMLGAGSVRTQMRIEEEFNIKAKKNWVMLDYSQVEKAKQKKEPIFETSDHIFLRRLPNTYYIKNQMFQKADENELIRIKPEWLYTTAVAGTSDDEWVEYPKFYNSTKEEYLKSMRLYQEGDYSFPEPILILKKEEHKSGEDTVWYNPVIEETEFDEQELAGVIERQEEYKQYFQRPRDRIRTYGPLFGKREEILAQVPKPPEPDPEELAIQALYKDILDPSRKTKPKETTEEPEFPEFIPNEKGEIEITAEQARQVRAYLRWAIKQSEMKEKELEGDGRIAEDTKTNIWSITREEKKAIQQELDLIQARKVRNQIRKFCMESAL